MCCEMLNMHRRGEPMYCWKCGNKNEDSSIYCEYCGSKLKKKDESAIKGQKTMTLRRNIVLLLVCLLVLFTGVIVVLVIHHRKMGNAVSSLEENVSLDAPADNNMGVVSDETTNGTVDEPIGKTKDSKADNQIDNKDATTEEQVLEDEEDDTSWKEKYVEIISDFETEYDSAFGYLFDLNGDGIPELFLEVDYNEPDGFDYSYTYVDGELIELTETVKLSYWNYAYFHNNDIILQFDTEDIDEKRINIYKMTKDDLIFENSYLITDCASEDFNTIPKYFDSSNNTITEEEFNNSIREYGFDLVLAENDSGYNLEFESYNDSQSFHTIYGFDLLISSVENYGTDVYDEAMAQKLCDADFQNYSFSYDKSLSNAWQDSFYDKIIEERAYVNYEADFSTPIAYFLYDIDKDSIPELFIKYGSCEADYSYTIFQYSNGVVEDIYHSYCGGSGFYALSNNDVIIYFAKMGGYSLSKISYIDGTIQEETVASGEVAEEQDYPDIEIFDNSARLLSFYSIFEEFPIFAYDVVITTKSTKSNEEVHNIITDVYVNNEMDIIITEDYSYSGYPEKRLHLGMNSDLTSLFDEREEQYHKSKEYWLDVNNDGQEEYIITYGVNENADFVEMVILSYQCGIVYTYCVSTWGDSIECENGKMIIDDSSGERQYEVKFYKDQIYYDVEYFY